MDNLSLSFESLKAGLLMATSFWIAASFFDRPFFYCQWFIYFSEVLPPLQSVPLLPIVKDIPSGYLPSLFS